MKGEGNAPDLEGVLLQLADWIELPRAGKAHSDGELALLALNPDQIRAGVKQLRVERRRAEQLHRRFNHAVVRLDFRALAWRNRGKMGEASIYDAAAELVAAELRRAEDDP